MTKDTERLMTAIWISGLMKSSGMINKQMERLLEHFGSAAKIFYADNDDVIQTADVSDKVRVKLDKYLNDDVMKEISELEAVRCIKHIGKELFHCVYINEKDYPFLLKQIQAPPSVLFYCSSDSIGIMNDKFCAAVIGTRNLSHYGEQATRKIVKGFNHLDCVIISGLARGIDSIAHQTALEENIKTCAVIGCGVDVVYPPENAGLMKRIMEQGIVISECPPGSPPVKSYFPARNRIISGLSKCIIVVEAASESGTMITAAQAGDQGRDVYAVPGSIFSPRSTGTNKLIADGACVVTSARDIINNYRYKFGERVITEEIGIAKTSYDNNDDRIEKFRYLISLLDNCERSFDELVRLSGLDTGILSETLSECEISGYVGFENGRYFLTIQDKSSISN